MTAIEILLIVLLVLIVVVSLLMMAIYIKKFFTLHKLGAKLSSFSLTQDDAQRLLADTNSTKFDKSFAMCCLIVMGVVPVHILVNEGGDYDDKLQDEKFKKNIHGRRIFEDLNNSRIMG